MTDIAVQAENLSKRYIIQQQSEQYKTLRDVIFSQSKRIIRGSKTLKVNGKKEFWALSNLNFEIKKGERLGIIGRNGAGKSTLLKVLSRITEPSSGRITLNGRVASLLEVGTGFHPELTGRENIFLNGAILGMSRTEIKKKFDEIVAFSEVEQFLETPVKRYSSGMYVRLAFAVAAHLEPEILIVDEVLAVGDAEFQKKCLGKMQDVSKKDGRTILFVSHNMAAVKALCTSGIVLHKGNMVFQGNQHESVSFYQSNENAASSFEHIGSLDNAPGNNDIRILKFFVGALQGDVINISSGFDFEIAFYNFKKSINLDITFELVSEDEIVVFHRGILISTQKDAKEGVYKVRGSLPPYTVNAGIYKFKLIFGENQRYPLLVTDDIIQFEVLNEMEGSNASKLPGILATKIPFAVTFEQQLNGTF